MRSRVVVGLVVALVVLALAGAGGGLWWHQHDQELAKARHEQQQTDAARAAAQRFASAWSDKQVQDARYTGSTPAAQALDFAQVTAALAGAPVSVGVASLTRTGTLARAGLAVTWTLAGHQWSYTDPIELDQIRGTWAVHTGGPVSLWHPRLRAGQRLTLQRTWAARAGVLDRDGRQLLPAGEVYDVQIDPVRADRASVEALEKVVGASPGSLVKAFAAAKKSASQAPIPVITYRQSDIDRRKAALNRLRGVIYPQRTQPLAPSRTFGQPLLGLFGPVTADVVTASKGRYAAGDYAGLSGLQGQYDSRLAGEPGLALRTTGTVPRVLFRVKPTPGRPVRLSLASRAQAAAEQALTSTGGVPSALVAVDVSDGSLLAVANSPSYGFDRALTGQYAPGSTLKVVTTYALLGKGLRPTDQVDCPRVAVIDGQRITNYESEELGRVPFRTDFAKSCNTAFAGLSTRLGDTDLHDAAAALGIGAGWSGTLGVPGVFDGSVPTNSGANDKAASSFGQGRTLASPLSLAVMAASVAGGWFRSPTLVTSPAPSGVRTALLDAGVDRQLRALMRQVVVNGTGTALAPVPGAPVYAKTGTAEFVENGRTKAHCWIVGWQSRVAFAALVETGRDGGTTAAPVAARFLRAMQ